MKTILQWKYFTSFFIVFLLGFALGTLTANKERHSLSANLTSTSTKPMDITSSDATQSPKQVIASPLPNMDDWDDLKVEFHELGEDENGLFIHGSIKNGREKDYSALQIEFELLDNDGKGYHTVRERQSEGLHKGDKWNFTIYIPYPQQQAFSSYRLYSLTAIGTGR